MAATSDATPEVSPEVSPVARLARLEADEQIRNLVAGYARAYDARDLEALAEIHDPQIREAAMARLRAQMQPGRTFHLTAEPVITHHGPDDAGGVVVCRAEAEVGDQWLVIGVVYTDRYVRRADRWFLADRQHEVAYASDVLSRPAPDRPPSGT
jgi:SnoaL-like domain